MCRICNSPPGSLGNHGGRLAVYKPFTGSPGVLLITTQGRPTHLTCGQTVMRKMCIRDRASDSVQVIIALKGEQRFPLFLVFVLPLDGLQPLGEAGIADEPLLSLANHSPNGLRDDMVF